MKRTIVIILALALVLTACQIGGKQAEEKPAKGSVKILYPFAAAFQNEYGTLLSTLYPDIDIEVVDLTSILGQATQEDFDYHTALMDLIAREQPDLLLLQPDQFKALTEDFALHSLESMVTDPAFDLDGIYPGLLKHVREMGGGQLYGLVNGFYSQALYYNKDLFDTYQIPYPTDQMSWDELLQLAARFPTDGPEDERIYGLKVSGVRGAYDLATVIGRSEELSFIDPNTTQVTIDSEAWKQVFAQAMQAIQSGSIYIDVIPGSVDAGSHSIVLSETHLIEPFQAGRVAMSLDYNHVISMLKQLQGQQQEQGSSLNSWDLVSVPVSKQFPQRNNYVNIANIFSISAHSTNKELAWQILSYMMGDDYAKAKSRSDTGILPARQAYKQDEEGRNVSAYYMLEPYNYDIFGDLRALPDPFPDRFQEKGKLELESVMEGEISLNDAITNLKEWAHNTLTAPM